MVTDGDMSAAATLTAAFAEHWREISRLHRAQALQDNHPELRAADENLATLALDAVSEESLVKSFELFLGEVVEARLKLENHLTKNAFKSVYGKKEGRSVPIDTNAPELFEDKAG